MSMFTLYFNNTSSTIKTVIIDYSLSTETSLSHFFTPNVPIVHRPVFIKYLLYNLKELIKKRKIDILSKILWFS